MALSPYQSSPYSPLAVSPTLDAQIKVIGAKGRFSNLGISVVDLTGNPPTPPYGGSRDDDMFFAASLVKIAAMFAAYQLLDAVRRDAATVGSTSAPAILGTLESAYSAAVAGGLPSGAPPQAPLLSKLFAITPSGTGTPVVVFDAAGSTFKELNANHENFGFINAKKSLEWLHLMIRWSSDCASSILISTLGMAYINGALATAGFFDPRTNLGIWLGGSYASACPRAQQALGVRALPWKPVSAAIQNAHSALSRFQVATSRAVALLFTCLAQGRLVDPTSSNSMLALLDKGTISPLVPGLGSVTRSFFGEELWKSFPNAHVWSKLGMDGPTNCDVALVERPRQAPKAPLRYIAVSLGDTSDDALHHLAVELDNLIDASHP